MFYWEQNSNNIGKSCQGMDKEITTSNDAGADLVGNASKQDEITTLEAKQSNGSVSDDANKDRRGHTRSTLALINRRLRLLFRPWKWRRKARSKRARSLDDKGMLRPPRARFRSH